MSLFDWDEFPNSLTLEGRQAIEDAHLRHMQTLVEKDMARFQGPPKVIPDDLSRYLKTDEFVKTVGRVVKDLNTTILRHSAVSNAIVEENLGAHVRSLQTQVTTLQAELALLRGELKR